MTHTHLPSHTHTHKDIRLLNKRLTTRQTATSTIKLLVVTAQLLINVTIKISVNKISIKETCSTFWKQSSLHVLCLHGLRL